MTTLVLDFDGTMTDAEAEGLPFVEGYLEDLATLVGRAPGDPELLEVVAQARAELAAAPASHPFLWMGRAVAPATVDPYLRMVPIAHRVLDRFGAFPSAVDRGRLLGGLLYRYNYARTIGRPVFRPGAGAALASLQGTDSHVVTNSDTHHVAGKIVALGAEHAGAEWLAPRVRGSARKFDVDDAWAGAPAELALPGLERPVLLRRRNYHDVLASVLAGKPFSDLVVVGDIFELDLAMPLAMGARVGLMDGPHTPAYERAFVTAHPRAALLRGVDEIRAFAFAG